MQDIQFPLTQPSQPLKRLIRQLIGRLLMVFMPERVRQLYKGAVGARLSTADRLLIAGLLHRHQNAGSLEALSALQRWLWQSDQALSFHAQAEARFEQWWKIEASQIVKHIQAVLTRHPDPIHTLCEIGCGSGLVLDDLQKQFPQLKRFIGLDLSLGQTERNQTRFPHLEFAAGDASEWLPQHADSGWIYLTNAGVLEYFSEAQLRQLFTDTAAKAPAVFALIEPIAADHCLESETRSIPFSAENTFSHNYADLLKQCGWHVCWHHDHRVDGRRHLMVVAQV